MIALAVGFVAGTTIANVAGNVLTLLVNNIGVGDLASKSLNNWSNFCNSVASFTGGTLRNASGNIDDCSAQFSKLPSSQYKLDTGDHNATFAKAFNSPGRSFAKLGYSNLSFTISNMHNLATAVNVVGLIARVVGKK